MIFLNRLTKSKSQEKDESNEGRELGKTYRDGDLKRTRGIRQTSVSGEVFSTTKTMLSIIIGAIVIGALVYGGYYFFTLALNW